MKKKIIEVSSDTNIGGAGKCLLTLLENFNYDEFEVKTILPKNSLLKPHMEKMGATVIEVDGIADKSLDFGAVSELRKIFKSEKPDLVHTHASMSARIAAKQAGVKVIYTRYEVEESSMLPTLAIRSTTVSGTIIGKSKITSGIHAHHLPS